MLEAAFPVLLVSTFRIEGYVVGVKTLMLRAVFPVLLVLTFDIDSCVSCVDF